MKLGKGHDMKLESRTIILGGIGVTVLCLVGAAVAASGTSESAHSTMAAASQAPATPVRPALAPISGREIALAMGVGQAGAPAAGQKPRMAGEVFKNVQVLKEIHVDDFMGTMGLMSAALGYCCSECHTGAGTQHVDWGDDPPMKRVARRMVTMVTEINKANFGGRQVVTCWTCHRGRDLPVVTPSMDAVYSEPKLEMDDVLTRAAGVPSVDQILDRYLQAIGGAQTVAGITSVVATGKSVFYGGFGGGAEVEFFAKAPDQRAIHIRYPVDPDRGVASRTYNGRTGWNVTPLAPLGRYELTGSELDGARLDALLSFPGQTKQALTNLRVGPPTQFNGKDYDVVQGNGLRGVIGTLYFARDSGLLERVVRLTPSAIGRVPIQMDYADYRDVGSSGIKMPYRWTLSWLDGVDNIELGDIRLNAPIDAAKFGEPTPLATQR